MRFFLDPETYSALVDVAWNDSINKLYKLSYSRTIDVQFGIYNKGFHKGWLTVNLKPSHGSIDWILNLQGWSKKTPYGKVHAGYWGELKKYGGNLVQRIDMLYRENRCMGILLTGRSKGAAEAELLIPMLPQVPIYCLAIEPPRCCDKEYQKSIISGTTWGMTTIYKNDVVPGIPVWFIHPFGVYQNGERKLGLSVKDHQTATEEKEVWVGEMKR